MKTIFLYSNNFQKAKLPTVVNGVLEIVEKHNPETLGVLPFFNDLSELRQQLEAYTKPRISHPLSSVITDGRKKEIDLIRSLQLQAKSIERANLPTQAEAAGLVLPLIKRYLMKVSSSYTMAVEKQINSFLIAISEKETISAATVTLGIDEIISELRLTFSGIQKNVDLRRSDMAAHRIIKESKLEETVINSISNLLKAIELAKVQHTAVNYTVVIAELNELFITYRTQYRSKKTRNMNAAIKKETVASSTTTTATAN